MPLAAYPGATAPAIAGVNLVIEPGQAIGIVGPTGSGKSALAAAIAGLLPLVSGRIEVDGAPVPNRLIGYVADEPRLIAGSVADNISGFEPSDEIDLLRTAIRAGVQDVLAALPRGYQTDVGIDGQKLPMRVRRAVALARAIHGGPGVLVLDEPGLGLDESGLTRLAGVLEALKREGTSLVLVTAQPRLLALMDSVAVMAHGKVQGVFQNRRAMRPGYPAAGSERGGSDAPRRVA